MNPWKNSGERWYRRKWETTVGDQHIYGWTRKSVINKAYREIVKRDTSRV